MLPPAKVTKFATPMPPETRPVLVIPPVKVAGEAPTRAPVPSTTIPFGRPRVGADPEIVPELKMLPENVEMLATLTPICADIVPLLGMPPVNVDIPAPLL